MFGRTALIAPVLLTLAIVAPARADPYSFPLDIRSERLSTALRDLARQTGAELLFDRDLVGAFPCPRVSGRMGTEEALQRLLRGSNLKARRSSSGVWIIERATSAAAESEELPVPEILVVGYRSQNADIRRRENDIQPYRVVSGNDVVSAHRDNIDQFLRSRVTANTQASPPSLSNSGAANSAIDLRGLGTEQTLVLVDGRRLPSVPYEPYAFGQSDINAIPLHAIERIETLTGTAGGIHGFGALGGVVNIVLKRDYRGAELHGSAGIGSRGDGRRLSLEGRIGFTPDEGRTHVMINVSRAWSQILREGQRGYKLRAQGAFLKADPVDFFTFMPTRNAVTVVSRDYFIDDDFNIQLANLRLKPQYGGAALGSTYSFLPTGFSGDPTALGAVLAQHAGHLEGALSDAGNATSIGSAPTTTSAIVSLRHDFGGGVEGYVDGLYLRNAGHARGDDFEGQSTLSRFSPLNPFDNDIEITFPTPPSSARRTVVFETRRVTAGVIAALPQGWKATAEASFARQGIDARADTVGYGSGQELGAGIDPFGDWALFQQAVANAYRWQGSTEGRARNHLDEQTLRLAGPVFATAAGPATLTMLVERRKERAPLTIRDSLFEGSIFPPPFVTATRSAHAELRAPLIGQDASPALLRGLELQLAVRRDRQTIDYASDVVTTDLETRRARFSATTFTAGAKVLPLPWLMLRGSYATGAVPPATANLIEGEREGSLTLTEDPKRPGEYLGFEGDYAIKYLGSPDLEAVRASTLSLGLVLNPLGDGAPRLSIDYSRILRSRDFFDLFLREDLVLEHEDDWPERVVRAPLSDADRAKGYTGGIITLIDYRGASLSRVEIRTIDGRIDWAVPLGGGRLRAQATATAVLRDRLSDPYSEPLDRVGFSESPLRWRVNAGLEWTRGPTTVGGNVQYFDRYRVVPAAYKSEPSAAAMYEGPHGGKWVRRQIYLDLYASHHFAMGREDEKQEFAVNLGLVNVLDRRPPYQASRNSGLAAGYSFYGDPRRRRFELGLSTRF